MYENGTGVLKSRDKAIEWYQKAAAQGDKSAIDRLKKLKVK
jgi:TPR repeat protein